MALAHVRLHFVGKHIYLERASSLYIHHSLLHSFVVRKRRKRDRVFFLDCTHQAVVITFWTQFLCSLGSLTRSVPLSHVLCTKIPLWEICPWYVCLQYYLGYFTGYRASPPTWNGKWTRGGWELFVIFESCFSIRKHLCLRLNYVKLFWKTCKFRYGIDILPSCPMQQTFLVWNTHYCWYLAQC